MSRFRYSNANIDLESLRPPPQQMLMYAPLMHHPLRQQLSQVQFIYYSLAVHVCETIS